MTGEVAHPRYRFTNELVDGVTANLTRDFAQLARHYIGTTAGRCDGIRVYFGQDGIEHGVIADSRQTGGGPLGRVRLQLGTEATLVLGWGFHHPEERGHGRQTPETRGRPVPE